MSEMAPDDKDWTWTLRRACPDCGFEAWTVAPADIADTIRSVTSPWIEVLHRPDARERPSPTTWSPVEYACHVRDVCDLFATRTRLMLEEDDPRFANWDQDVTAVEKDYRAVVPTVVATELLAAAAGYAAVYDEVAGEAWERTGTRSDGSSFTVATLGQYGLHDLAHHLWDVRGAADSQARLR